MISGTDVARDNNGVYVHEQYALTSRIFVTGGARLEHSSTFGNKFTPRGAVTFRLPTETYFRLSLARGIKEPALIENFANESFFVGNPALKPEKTDSFEAGLFRDWLGKRVRTEVSVFPQPVHGPDRVRLLAESCHVGEHRPELGARRGALGLGEGVAIRERRARTTPSCTRVMSRQSDRSGTGAAAAQLPARFRWS